MRKSNARHEPANAASGAPAAYMSADERRAAGKALRDATPRAAHGGWKSPEGRRDPVELLREANEGRIAELIPLRFSRMAQSPFAFYRGAAAIMAADLASTPTSGLRVQACGDAHLMNFGGFATPERNIFFDINDFDETLPAPWEWDVKRLAASIVIAAHHINLPNSEAAKAATESVCSYRERMADYASMRALDVWYDRIDLDRVLKVLPPATRRESLVTWAPIRRSTTRCASSRSNTPTRTFATIAALAERSAKVESRLRPRIEPFRRPERFRSRLIAETGRCPAGLPGAPSSCPRRRTARLR